MKTTLKLGLSAAFFAATSALAMAQGASVNVNAGGNANAGPKVDVGTEVHGNAGGNGKANAGGNSANTYGALISSLRTGVEVNFADVTSDSNITIRTLSSLQGEGAENAQALDNFLDDAALADLRADVAANAAIMAQLGAFTPDDVVAVTTAADGSVIVYVDDRT